MGVKRCYTLTGDDLFTKSMIALIIHPITIFPVLVLCSDPIKS